MYIYAADDSISVFTNRLSELQALGDPIFFRAYELVQRPQVVNKTRYMLNYTRIMLKSIAEDMPWVPDEDREAIETLVSDMEEWLDRKESEQKEHSPYEEPIFTTRVVQRKLERITQRATQLLKTEKPPPPKPKPKPPHKHTTKKHDIIRFYHHNSKFRSST